MTLPHKQTDERALLSPHKRVSGLVLLMSANRASQEPGHSREREIGTGTRVPV
jgi:hypothetical protein